MVHDRIVSQGRSKNHCSTATRRQRCSRCIRERSKGSCTPGSRHTYRSWLDETEFRRSQTTMNVYGQAMSSSKREANGKDVEMVLKPVAASA